VAREMGEGSRSSELRTPNATRWFLPDMVLLPTSPHARHARSCLALHAPRSMALADILSILLV